MFIHSTLKLNGGCENKLKNHKLKIDFLFLFLIKGAIYPESYGNRHIARPCFELEI